MRASNDHSLERTVSNDQVDEKPAINTKHTDAAFHFLAEHEIIEYTAEEEKALIRKIDLVLMPLVSLKQSNGLSR